MPDDIDALSPRTRDAAHMIGPWRARSYSMPNATSACESSAASGSPSADATRGTGFQSTPGPPVKDWSAVPYVTGKSGCDRSSCETNVLSAGHDAASIDGGSTTSRTTPSSTLTSPLLAAALSSVFMARFDTRAWRHSSLTGTGPSVSDPSTTASVHRP